jgi:DNA (cytosine-5)-methyltransferase 1
MQPVLALDNDGEALRTLRANHDNVIAWHGDIAATLTSDLTPYLPRERSRPVLFCACAPCQPFSRQNRQKKEDDHRADLLGHFLRFLQKFRPEYIFVENVPEIRKATAASNGPLDRLIGWLSENGYWHAQSVISAQQFGVPQNRQRLILVASAFGEIRLPEATHGEGLAPSATVLSAIGDLPVIEAGEVHGAIVNHRASNLSPENMRRITATPVGGGRRNWAPALRLKCHEEVKGYADVYGRMAWDRPAPSLTTRCISLSNGRFGHPSQNRAISVREAARLQSFDDTFVFHGSLNSMARQVGNAVPPRLAEAVGRAIVADAATHWTE